jgi:hypothetical protein
MLFVKFIDMMFGYNNTIITRQLETGPALGCERAGEIEWNK